ncbi:MAG: type II toxin-antitoxin system HicB family antitoxin [Candidatus Altiarchaeia archaeon]|jgi:predicted RNase H-like HicB family nuclease
MKKGVFRDYTVIVEKDEDGFYVGEVVELPGCHTQAKTVEELMKRMEEAVSLYLEVKSDSGNPSFVGLHKIKVRIPSTA